MCITTLLTTHPIEGVEFDLASRVLAGLYLKRAGKSSVDVDVEKMAIHYGSDKETMVKIIQWYEGNLISTKFVIR